MKSRVDRLIRDLNKLQVSDQNKVIQAMSGIEGINYPVAMESLLDGMPIYDTNGTTNRYKTYSTQVIHTYKKYDGEEDYGCAQVRLVVDLRCAFIVGEGMSVTLGKGVKKAYRDLFDKFIKKNRLNANRLFTLCRDMEMSGYSLAQVINDKTDEDLIPIMGIHTTCKGTKFIVPELENVLFPYKYKGFKIKREGKDTEESIDSKHKIFFCVKGCDASPTTKIGLCLTDCENYDRAVKDLRELNYRTSRVTPDFETKDASETAKVSNQLKSQKWKIGQARIGTAKFNYKVPTTGAHDNLLTEATTALKTISGVTGVPVHWAGFVDLMSNRATADDLYSSINNATIMERNEICAGLYETFKQMQQMYIDSGGDLISEVTDDFEIQLPLIDLGSFKEMVDAYSTLYADDIISKRTYQNIVPKIDPLFEDKQIEAEKGDLVTKSNIPADLQGDDNGSSDNKGSLQGQEGKSGFGSNSAQSGSQSGGQKGIGSQNSRGNG